MLQFKHERKQWFIFNSPLEISYASALILVKGKLWRYVFFFFPWKEQNWNWIDPPKKRCLWAKAWCILCVCDIDLHQCSNTKPNQNTINKPKYHQQTKLLHWVTSSIHHAADVNAKTTENHLQHLNFWCSYVYQDLLSHVFYNEQLETQECSLNVQATLVSKDVNMYGGFGLAILA